MVHEVRIETARRERYRDVRRADREHQSVAGIDAMTRDGERDRYRDRFGTEIYEAEPCVRELVSGPAGFQLGQSEMELTLGTRDGRRHVDRR